MPSLEKSKRATTLCHSSVFSFCPAPGTVLLLLLSLPLAPVALSPPFRASPFCPPSFLLPFSLTAAAGVVLNSSHSRCLFARFNWKVLHAAHNAANDPRTVCVYTHVLLSDHLSLSLSPRSVSARSTFDSPERRGFDPRRDRHRSTRIIVNYRLFLAER